MFIIRTVLNELVKHLKGSVASKKKSYTKLVTFKPNVCMIFFQSSVVSIVNNNVLQFVLKS